MSFYTDPEFPTDQRSIGKQFGDKIEWKRPRDFMDPSKRVRLFDGIDPNDIQQGKLGDCYFLCALSMLAEFPERIEELFKPSEINKDGVNPRGEYVIKFYPDGVKTTIKIDDLFPCVGDVPIFSRNVKGENEIWVMLLEKAYAKWHNSYGAIEAGITGDAISDLCGSPYQTYDLKQSKSDSLSADELWKILKHSDEKEFMMCCGIQNGGRAESGAGFGLLASHAYALLVVKQGSNGVKLVQIRNPWGHAEWTGDYGDKSDKWTPALKREMGWEDKDDGIFWMEFKDFIRNFSNVTVMTYYKNAFQEHTRINLKKTMHVIPVNIYDSGTDATFTIHTVRGTKSIAHYRSCVLEVNKEGKPIESLGGSKETFLEREANSTEVIKFGKPGKYLLVIQVYPKDSHMLPLNVTISAYANKEVSFDDEQTDTTYCDFYLPSYKEKYGSCDECTGPLNGASTSALGKIYHVACFVCKKCRNKISGSFFPDPGGDLPTCQTCQNGGGPRGGAGTGAGDSPVKKGPRVCVGCGQKLTGQYVIVLGSEYHKDCFKCTGCGKIFGDMSFYGETEPMCEACIRRK